MEVSAEQGSGESGEPLNLLTAYADLYDLLFDRPDTDTFLRRIADLAVLIVPGARCSVTFHQHQADAVADLGPPTTGNRIPHQPTRDPPWELGDDPADMGGGASLPLVVQGINIATLNLQADPARPFRDADLVQARAFAHQAANALALLLREAAHLTLDDQLQEALVTRTVIDQAMGVLMHARQIRGRQALRMLRRISQTTNRKVSVLAAEVITKMTGQPPEKPRPLTRRRDALQHYHDEPESS